MAASLLEAYDLPKVEVEWSGHNTEKVQLQWTP